MITIGNCYCWAIILKVIYGGEIFTVDGEFGVNGRNVTHYMLKDRNGRVRHFRRTYDFFPEPFCYWVFLGRIESSGKRKKK